ncbi:hypothetical protein ACOBR2_10360 [Telmatobacter bradus]|uniref:hypothetical protein n=1 Tax=Telmatobacter bradus TaxID=474953 RepID=UPI003B428ACC
MATTALTATAGLLLAASASSVAQTQSSVSVGPIAIISLNSKTPGAGPKVSGGLEVDGGRAMIGASGTVTAGKDAALVQLPRRGEMRLCATTSVKLAVDTSLAGEPGLLVAIERGALEMSLANTTASRNSDVLLTPDFRILISGPGAAVLKVRLGEKGDTCIDNVGTQAPYVLVSNLFEGGAYRVQAGEKIVFQHGSLHESVSDDKEDCGCPPGEHVGNEFPLAQSEGLEPLPATSPSSGKLEPLEPLAYNAQDKTQKTAVPASPQPAPAASKPGILQRVGNFFRRIFGADSAS